MCGSIGRQDSDEAMALTDGAQRVGLGYGGKIAGGRQYHKVILDVSE